MNISETFKKIDLKYLEMWINDKQEENLSLDFKTITKADFSNRDDRKNFAKALSGFANSSGGLIVWGINARKNSEGIDCATDKCEIEPLSMFMSKLNNLTGELVNPAVDKIKHKKISAGSDKGFAVTIVPESDSIPHIAKGGEDRYYKRSGDSFYRMEHFDIEDMFGRRKKPKLSLSTKIVRGSYKGTTGGLIICTILILIGIKNSGRALAKAPYLAIHVKPPYSIYEYGIDGNRTFGLKKLPWSVETNEIRYGASLEEVIHPSIVHNVTAVSVKVDISNNQLLSPPSNLELHYKIAAEDIRLVEGKTVIEGQELLENIKEVHSLEI